MYKRNWIIMSGTHPLDIIAGRKTETRRCPAELREINKDPDKWLCQKSVEIGIPTWQLYSRTPGSNENHVVECSYGEVGSELWVKET